MKKIISVFQRNYETDRLIRDEVVPGAEWVLAGEGVATRKYDGACCMVKGGVLYKRYDCKQGRKPPYGFIPAQEPDPTTGHWPGWVETGNGNEDKWFRDAFTATRANIDSAEVPDGTYEAIGPHFQSNEKNPEGLPGDVLMPHGCYKLNDCPRDFEGIKKYLEGKDIEGVVFHHPDGRMAKVKKKDFGMRRKPAADSQTLEGEEAADVGIREAASEN